MATGDEINRRRSTLSGERAQLAAAQQALLEKRLRRKPADASNENAIPRRSGPGPAPLSFAQQRLWFLAQMEPDSPAYNNTAAVQLTGPLDVAALESGLSEIVWRHEALRTQFVTVQGNPVQIASPARAVTLPLIDLRALPLSEREDHLRQLIVEEARRPFDLTHGLLIRATLLWSDETRHVLQLTMHHIASDGWSAGVLIRELAALYQAFSTGRRPSLAELPLQYADFAAWQRQRLQGETLEKLLAYWKEKLTGAPEKLELATDRPRPAVQTYRGALWSFRLPQSLSEALAALSRQEQASLFMTLLAAFKLLLYRYTGQPDIVVGSPIANRAREVEGLIGFFVNTLVLRTSLADNPTFRELLARVREVTFGAYAHQDVPFEKLVEELQLERNLSHTPLFQVMFILQNAPLPPLDLPGLRLSPLEVDGGVAKFDLSLALTETPQGLSGAFEYNTDLFDRDTISRLQGHFQTLLEGVVANPDRRITDLPLLTEAEQHRLLVAWNSTQIEYPRAGQCVHDWFEAQAEEGPDRIAVVFEDQQLTYQELNGRANQLAHFLQAAGVGPEVLVGLCLERSLEMVLGLLGILKAGGAYVPLDPTYPPDRLAFMLADAQIPLVLTQAQVVDSVPAQPARVVCLDRDWPMMTAQVETNPAVAASGDQAVYLIYTSGSTGKPKGVINTQRGLGNRLLWMQAAYQLTPADRVLQKTPFSFDVSVWEFFWPLSVGACLVVARPEGHKDSAYLVELIAAQQISTLHFVPSMLQAFVAEPDVAACHSLRRVISSGEALPFDLQQRFFSKVSAELHNLYGPTEAAIDVTYWACRPDSERRSVPIGRPIANTQIYLLDTHLQPVPIGVPGELHIGGLGMARGYRGRPDLTAERFIPNPFPAPTPQLAGRRLYKTGDLARYLPDGSLEYLGRLDHQVKVRGFRIELGEIETVLARHPAVRDVVVMARDVEHTPGHKRLVAYVIPTGDDRQLDENLQRRALITDLQHFLKDQLPDYMVPAAFVFLTAWPLTTNGKIDRQALPSSDQSQSDLQRTFVAPRTPLEQELAEIWAQVLGLEQVGIQDNFFGLGGDSILSIQVLARARDQGLHFSLQQLFQHQTIEDLTADLAPARLDVHVEPLQPFSLISEEDRRRLPSDVEDAYPLVHLQAGMLFHMGYQSQNVSYHNVSTFHVKAPFDRQKLQAVLQQLATRHPVLRTSFDLSAYHEPLQLIHQSAGIVLQAIDLRSLPAEEQDAQVRDWFETEKLTPFDSSRLPLWRVCAHQRSEETFQLSLSEHHGILDGWSLASLLTELFQLYLVALGSTAVSIPPAPTLAFRDFVVAERQTLDSEDARRYWSAKLADSSLSSLPRWPAAYRATTVREMRVLDIPISPDLSAGLKRLARSAGVPIKSVLLAAHLRVLSLLSGQTDVVSGLVSNGRPEGADGERVLGLFLNTLPFRLSLSGGSWIELVQATFAGERELLPFRRYPLPELQKLVGRQPLFEASFNFVHFHVYQGTLGFKEIQVLEGKTFQEPNFNLVASFGVGAASAQVQLDLGYNAAELCDEQVKAIGTYYANTLTAMANDPAARYESYRLLPLQEQHRLLHEWNDTSIDYQPAAYIHELFEARAAETPDAAAVMFEDQQLTYGELNRRANQLAQYLRRRQVGPDGLVGICAERSVEMVVGLLGILKAGGAYVPFDPTYPPERLAFMLKDAGVRVLLAQSRLAERLPAAQLDTLRATESLIWLDKDWDAISRSTGRNLAVGLTDSHLAYMIYTSGSTGTPKGAMNTHVGIRNRLQWMQATYSLTTTDRVLQKTPFSFDVSVWEFFWPLLAGAGLVVARPEGHKDSAYLAQTIIEQNITTLHFVPSMLRVFLEEQRAAACHNLKRVICSGEALSFELQERFFDRLPHVELHNLYGPTEAAVDVTYWTCEPHSQQQVVPIGHPIANTQIYLLDSRRHLVPASVPGELYIGGAGLARGYLGRPDLTADRFIPNPFEGKGTRLYKTGDLARYLPDGSLEFLGRIDYQVKLRGFRIELGEIEAALLKHPQVREAIVLAQDVKREVGDSESSESKRLVAYLVPQGGLRPAISDLRNLLQAQLPEYMLPAAFVMLEALPLTSSGKVDRRALPSPEPARPEVSATFVAPRNPIEAWLAELWAQVLRLEEGDGRAAIGIHDNYFELGGDSIQAAVLINKLQEQLGEFVYVVALFDAPTIAGLAAYLNEHYPQAIARKLGHEASPGSTQVGPTITAAQVAQLRQIIPPLPRRLAPPLVKNRRAVFVLSPPRSGSTLLRVILGGHPRLFSPPELELMPFNTLAERASALSGRNSFWLEGTLRAIMQIKACTAEEARRIMQDFEEQDFTTQQLYHVLQEWLGDRLLVDKSPSYALDLEILKRLEEDFEEAQYIHLLRHPYGMLLSFEEARLDQVFFRYPHPFSRRELGELIWLISQQNILEFLKHVPPQRQLRVRYEDLVRDPHAAVTSLCEFLGLDFQPAMLQPYQDEKQRMTDGVHQVSKMLGDIKFKTHTGIEAQTADRWREHYTVDFLGDATWQLAAALGYERPAPPTGLPSLSRRPEQDSAPLSFAQQRLWFLDQLSPGSSFYNIPSAVRLTGRLDIAALEQSFNQVIRRQATLRTTFATVKGQPIPVIAPSLTLTLLVVDLRELAGAARESQMRRLALQEAQSSFDLERGPLVRATLVWLDTAEYVLLLTMHHIVSDGWSMGVMIREMAAYYRAASGSERDAVPSMGDRELPDLPIQYADFAAWQRQWLQGEVLESQLTYWKQQLVGAPALLSLAPKSRPAVQTFHGSTLTFAMPRTLAEELKTLSRREGVTLFMTLLAAFDTVLYRYTGQSDIVIGSPTANRNRAEVEGLIGFFISTLVLRTNLTDNPPFRELLERVRQTTTGAYAHQDLPFEMIVEALQPERSLSHSPLFQVMFALQNAPMGTLELPGLTFSPVDVDNGTSKFDLTLSIWDTEQSFTGAFEYNTDLFDAPFIERLAGHFQTLLHGVVAQPEQRLSELPLLSETERRQLLLDWNDTLVEYPEDLGVHELFERQVERIPEAVALVFEDECLTFKALNGRANQLAHYLQTLGVGPEVPVGICVERSVEMIVGILGILKAGGAYVPLDPLYPLERLAYIVQEAQAAIVLTQARLAESLPPQAAQIICLDKDWATWAQHSVENPASAVTASNLVYVIFTSGSTGQPKGTAIEHRQLLNYVRGIELRLNLPDQVHYATVSTIAADLGNTVVFSALCRGGCLHVIAEDRIADSDRLAEYASRHPIDCLKIVPSHLAALLTGPHPEQLLPRQRLVLGGEASSWELIERVQTLAPHCAILNHYGPTETTVGILTYPVTQTDTCTLTVPLGRPLGNVQIYLLDGNLQPVPLGMPGEVYVGGDSLARGYLNHPEWTAEKFVPNPFTAQPGARLYKTGDLARYLPASHGNLEFLGRVDHQVKLRGYRVEVREIEAALLQSPTIREAVVLVREDLPHEKRLVAYLVVNPPAALEPAELRRFLRSKLPEYMVPATFVTLEALPLTPNGKVDQRALPAPERVKPDGQAAFVAPHTPIEQTLADIWVETLRLDRADGQSVIGIHDNFFELGGHSLLAAQVRAHIRDALQVELPLRQLFETPTIAGLAESIELLRWAAPNTAPSSHTSTDSYEEMEL